MKEMKEDFLRFIQGMNGITNTSVIPFIPRIITETSPYSFGNFRKLSLYNCFMLI